MKAGMYIHVLMRDEKEGRKKQARSNKQQGKVTQHTQGNHFSYKKNELPRVGGSRTHNTTGWTQISHLIVHLTNRLTIMYMYMYMPTTILVYTLH